MQVVEFLQEKNPAFSNEVSCVSYIKSRLGDLTSKLYVTLYTT